MPLLDEDCANPLLVGWIREWWDTARERSSKGALTYKHAYDSLRACPITFTHPAQLQQLKGFGPKLTHRLTEQLKKHCEQNDLPMPKRPARRNWAGLENLGEASPPPPPPKRARPPKLYVPAYRSGGYALVLALSTADRDERVGMTKAALIDIAQPHCDASFTAPSDPTKFYTAWNSIKTLLDKELVCERGRPLKRYTLTDEGWDVASRIRQAAAGQGIGQDGPPLPAASEDAGALASVVADGPASGAALPSFTPIRLAPGSFTVHLVLDTREVRAKTDRSYIQQELAKRGVTPITRSLELGDALWVAKCHDAGQLARGGAEGDEIVLDWIVERKRLDDLIGSIKDGRFHEQKFRLRRSGVRNIVYLVEEMALDAGYYQKYEAAVQSAIASTQVVNGYFLKRTVQLDETIRYLARMTMLLKRQYEGRELRVIPTGVLTAQNYLPRLAHLRGEADAVDHYISYAAFASLASKSDTMTLRDVFLKMLMCTKGVTAETAVELQKRWKTPVELVQAFEACGPPGEAGDAKRREMVLAQMGGLFGRKKVTKALSATISQVWGED